MAFALRNKSRYCVLAEKVGTTDLIAPHGDGVRYAERIATGIFRRFVDSTAHDA